MVFSRPLLRTVSDFGYAFFVLIITTATALSCAALLSQAVRTAPNRSWSSNFNAFVIGASYAAVLVASLMLCLKRRIAVRLRLQRISKVHKTIGGGDVPDSVYRYITQEYVRACLISYTSSPRDAFHEGWGRPGTSHQGIRFKDHLLDTIPQIDELAHKVIPSHPSLRQHARILHHFRFIIPLLNRDKDGLTPLHKYDSVIQIARNSSSPLSEGEFELGMEAAAEMIHRQASCTFCSCLI
ncbi:hypothetical protein AMATHDRAFT_72417 [Amanita thiersii Skay4041]|uniref:Defect at low temperature protein 1 n=1 Tax=Amanita thiersii Skay4041 TaxID=703135 RepID=A0A2A9NYG6_9AGAR|nr:hypothetical protein AMATHDRAFT_72417 [Amanita thiersii Skay4041]